MAARLFGLKFFAGKPSAPLETSDRWSPDAPLDIPHARDLMEFAYPPESAFAEPDESGGSAGKHNET